MKTQILAALGEAGLQPQAALNTAFAANDRVKYVFSLLQMALVHAENPGRPVDDLKRERLACGIDAEDLDTVVESARTVDHSCRIAGASTLLKRIADDMRVMAAPIIAAKADGWEARLSGLIAALPQTDADLVDPAVLAAMMQIGHGAADSPHRLVMDMHKRLNVLQSEMAQEDIDGASASNMTGEDRRCVAAFMAGIKRTAFLKFTHPGLATTATRMGERLVIQNDIGTTDAHVIVIHVEALVILVTYTDVHQERLAFFEAMMQPSGMTWTSQGSSTLTAGSLFFLATGRLETKSLEDCCNQLESLGSRLVFLIDWNRARKQLRGFLRGPDRTALLLKLSVEAVGHRGFLELDGKGLVNQAIEASGRPAIHFGDRLCDVLGDAEAVLFLAIVFKLSTEALVAGHSRALVNDSVRVELAKHFHNKGQQLLGIAADHAGLIFELATLASDGRDAESDRRDKWVHRAKRFEHDADGLVSDMRTAVRRRPDYAALLRIIECADDAADALDDAVFLFALMHLTGKPRQVLDDLADALSDAAQEWVKALGAAARLGRAASEQETADFFKAVEAIATLEHRADTLERALAESAVRHADDFRQLHLFIAIGDTFEAAADALHQASMILRDYVLETVING